MSTRVPAELRGKYKRCMDTVNARNKKAPKSKRINAKDYCDRTVVKVRKKKRKDDYDYEVAVDIDLKDGYEVEKEFDD